MEPALAAFSAALAVVIVSANKAPQMIVLISTPLDFGFEVHYNHAGFKTAFAVKAYRH
jgi:hypothetical protein